MPDPNSRPGSMIKMKSCRNCVCSLKNFDRQDQQRVPSGVEASAGGELKQLDERLREVSESIASIKTSLQILEVTVGMMNKALNMHGKFSLQRIVSARARESRESLARMENAQTAQLELLSVSWCHLC